MPSRVNVAIIGGGIVGLATGLEILRRFPRVSLTVIEKETKVAAHQTSHNSGVIHSGIYYKPGSLKARLCTEGANALLRFCDEHVIPYEICGKVIVATSQNESLRLDEIYRRGIANGLNGLRMLTCDEIRELEPHAAGIRGIHVPATGIVDYGTVARKYAELIEHGGGTIRVSHEVVALRPSGNNTTIETTQGPIEAQLVINCAGLQSDRVSRMANARLDLTIVPFRGEYYELVPDKRHYVRSLLYPVPDPRFPFLGVHFTKRIGGGVEAGPNAVLALAREGYSKADVSIPDIADSLGFQGLWRFLGRYPRASWNEVRRSFSKARFCRSLQRLVPEIHLDDLVPGGSGVRAQAMSPDGTLVDDFSFVEGPREIHVVNAPSPAATASLAIGAEIASMVEL